MTVTNDVQYHTLETHDDNKNNKNTPLLQEYGSVHVQNDKTLLDGNPDGTHLKLLVIHPQQLRHLLRHHCRGPGNVVQQTDLAEIRARSDCRDDVLECHPHITTKQVDSQLRPPKQRQPRPPSLHLTTRLPCL